MAAWGITYSTSHERVTTMASEFTDLAQGSLNMFGSFVANLLDANARLVGAILAVQRTSGVNRTEQSKAAMARTIGVLVNYTTNATDQTQMQMARVVDTFGSLMDTVVADFKNLASGYAAQVRADLASKGSAVVSSLAGVGVDIFNRIQKLNNFGMVNLTRAPTDPIGPDDCLLLYVICDYGAELSSNPLSFASSTGRLYRCGALEGATISMMTVNGGRYNETRRRWLPYASNVSASAQKTIKDRCLTDSPVEEVVGLNCLQTPAPNCQCGADPRCLGWYQPLVNATATYFITKVLVDEFGEPNMNTFMPLLDFTATPAKFLGVLGWPAQLSGVDYLVTTSLGFLNGNSFAMVLNETGLPTVASSTRKCTANESVPGDPSLPVWSSLRSCDPGLRAVARWLAGNSTVTQPFSLEYDGLLWDVSPVKLLAFSYFFIVGSNRSLVNQPIEISEARATAELAGVHTGLMKEVAATGAAARAYMSAAGAQNRAMIQAMQDNLLLEIQALENTSLASLAASQEQTFVNVQSITENQAAQVDALQARHLSAMATATGWTIGVVCAILLAVLLLSAWGTIRVNHSLLYIIGLMEDVANMKVEDLEVPQSSAVTEVARIQTAFQVLVLRLVEYKSYIPAGLFEKDVPDVAAAPGPDDDKPKEGCPSDQPGSERCPPHTTVHQLPCKESRSSLDPDGHPPRQTSRSSAAPMPPSPAQKILRKNVAVLSVNLTGFMDLLLAANEGVTKAKFNDYITHVHGAVSADRGNVDCVLGDQIFVTFNAHIPCADPAGAAAAAALEVRHQLLRHLGDKLKFQVGLSFGPAFASSVGYAKFKCMVTVGAPLKLASILSHLTAFENGSILADAGMEERAKYAYGLRPVELVHLPNVKTFVKSLPLSQSIFLLQGKKDLHEDEWLYQVQEGDPSTDWNVTFNQLVAATSLPEGESLLQQYLTTHPQDEVALRLRDRLAAWIPGLGIPL
eukprot:EG_transcript_1261